MNRRLAFIAPAAIALLACVVYLNSLRVPFLLDDEVTILANPSIRDLTDLGAVLQPPAHVFSAGRPLLNLSFALNHAFGGNAVVGYHVVNLLIHALACLALFGLVRRTLALPQFRWETPRTPDELAAGVAAVWALHPLQTASVTYISQRAESLMVLCYLLTLYCFLRARTAADAKPWIVGSVVACAAGALTKETMATAPLVVLAFDHAFFGESLVGSVRRHSMLYVGYALSWVMLAGLALSQHLAERGVGYEHGVSAAAYALAETRAFTRYVALAAWPQPLVFDYGVEFFDAPAVATLGGILFVLASLAAGIWAWRRSVAVGFCALAFFLILAPTTTIVPIALQPMAENRMYLPLAAFAVLAVVGVRAALGSSRALWLGAVAVLALAGLTIARNREFGSAVKIWSDTVAKRPQSSRAHNNLGLALLSIPARRAEAAASFYTALRLKPDFPEAHNNLGVALGDLPGRQSEVLAHYAAALGAKPTFAQAHANFANALLRVPGRESEGLGHYRTALTLQPDNAKLHADFAAVLANDANRRGEAIAQFEMAVRLDPEDATAHAGLARLLARETPRRAEAAMHYEAARRLDPSDAETCYNFANLLATDDVTLSRAIENYEAALRLNPDLGPAYNNLAIALYRADRLDDAIARLELAQQRGIANEAALKNLAELRSRRGR